MKSVRSSLKGSRRENRWPIPGNPARFVQIEPRGVAHETQLPVGVFVEGTHIHHEGRVSQLSRGHAAPEARAGVEQRGSAGTRGFPSRMRPKLRQ